MARFRSPYLTRAQISTTSSSTKQVRTFSTWGRTTGRRPRPWPARCTPARATRRVEQVFAHRHHVDDGKPGEIVVHQPGMAQLTAHEPPPASAAAQPLARQIDGVQTLGRRPSVRRPFRRARTRGSLYVRAPCRPAGAVQPGSIGEVWHAVEHHHDSRVVALSSSAPPRPPIARPIRGPLKDDHQFNKVN